VERRKVNEPVMSYDEALISDADIPVWTPDDERCYWMQMRDNAADELAARS
jgi:hypothetical protein